MPTSTPIAIEERPCVQEGLSSLRATNEPDSLAVFTLVVWLMCLFVGALGFVLHYERPRPPSPPDQPILLQQLQVELMPEPLPPPDPETSLPDPLVPPPPPDALVPPVMAQPIAVAQPSPAIAFALPVEGPTRIVEANRAAYGAPPGTNTSAPPSPGPSTIEKLTLGQGEGKQPAPHYPPAARSQQQEGTVVVRFTVGMDGRVLASETALPSPWPLLNEAALRVVRERWRFRSGSPRIYEVAIRFEITK